MGQKESYLDELPEITRRIRQVSDPDKIILFGSYARGEAGQHSDMDLMVIKNRMASVLAETKKIYRALANLAVPIDIVVVSQEYLEQYGKLIGTVLYPALKEGIILYER